MLEFFVIDRCVCVQPCSALSAGLNLSQGPSYASMDVIFMQEVAGSFIAVGLESDYSLVLF